MLKWRIEAITALGIEPVFASTAMQARKAWLAAVGKIAATDPVRGPAMIALAKTARFTAPGPLATTNWMLRLNPEDERWLDNYVRVDVWWE